MSLHLTLRCKKATHGSITVMECRGVPYACRKAVISVFQSLSLESAIRMARSKDLFCLSTSPLARCHNADSCCVQYCRNEESR